MMEQPAAAPLAPATFADLEGWNADAVEQAWSAFLTSCTTLVNRPEWQAVCTEASTMSAEPAAIRAFFESRFLPFQLTNPDGSVTGLITGYYEPLLRGSRTRTGEYKIPLYAAPEDLLIIDLSTVAPDTKHMRLRGRLEGRKVVPYYSRAEIDQGAAPVAGKEIVWVDDAVEAFFLQIQGSGRVQLPDGSMVRVGYADQNGHPYKSIGRVLIERGELQLHEASMQGIQRWARTNPDKLAELLAQNPSYVFFRELPPRDGGPIGALGVPLTPERSIAVDPRHVPLGAPVFLATTRPNSDVPLQRLMVAQDTGGAIRGVVRADFYWGFGPAAGAEAGRMRQQGRMWVLLPRDHPQARAATN
ncbi:MAG TPA: murein transglycosylase A [Burkholderiales bacterium]|nr:murein transglycosylase A [Burkholderiales bacterium]